jgi:hypothetical protein
MQTSQTVEIENLTFADWQAIAIACGNSEKYGLYKWLENASSSSLKQIAIEEWIELAQLVGYSQAWAAKKFVENKLAA